MNIIEFADVRRAYRSGHDVLHGVSFSVDSGEVVGLVGRNGAGKTTLIRLAMGMLAPGAGRIRVFGLDPRRDPVSVKARIGYVAEDQVLPPFLRVDEVVELHRGLFPEWDDTLASELAHQFSLPGRERIGNLSKGQARQVALLCAVAHRPELLLLDEPAGGLDPAARREFLETSIRLLNEAGSTILFSSHHMTDVERVAGRVVLIHDGRLLLDHDIDDLREGFSVALIPRDRGIDRARLRSMTGCVGVRERGDALHAVFRMAPEASRSMLADAFGVIDARCHSAALEEMFIELVGGQA